MADSAVGAIFGTIEDRVLNLLAVEDKKKVALALQKGLESERYDVQVALTGEEGF